jgi:hypothetical protein
VYWELSVPHGAAFVWHVIGNRDQSTPALLGSFVTVAVKLAVLLIGTWTIPVGAGVNAMEIVCAGGGGGFWGLKVLVLPHPASIAIIATGRRERIHRLVGTANLLRVAS